MSPDRKHSVKDPATKPIRPTRYRRRHLSLRDLEEQHTAHIFDRINIQPCPKTDPTYFVFCNGESHSISLTNENFPAAFGYGERQRKVRRGSRSRQPSPAGSPSNTSSSSTISSPSPSNVYLPPSWSLPPNDAYTAPQDSSIPLENATQDIPPHGQIMASHLAIQPSPSISPLQCDFNNYLEGNIDIDFGTSQLTQTDDTHAGFGLHMAQCESFSDQFNPTIDPNPINLFVGDQPSYYHFPLMNNRVDVLPTPYAPAPSLVPSGGQPHEYPPRFMCSELPQILYSTSNNAIYHDQQNFDHDIYLQQYQDSDLSITSRDPNTAVNIAERAPFGGNSSYAPFFPSALPNCDR
ncbi:hypothetical protein M413DRAFT_27240 [Hebeloma cylindrosporum]|uniref:Uncharacterized protein n=1 Tax=Hebeloma cylindrosporum TaxID=76867 RepID=A0A0C2YN96_HEBCY|nr:hypothetical protein M413DRAFT_27240 [Hebeloma cylindrosporum h7]